MLILFPLKVLQKFVFIICGVITLVLWKVKIQMILLEKFLILSYITIKKELKNIKGSDFVFESVDLLEYKLHRVRLKRVGSYVRSSKWLENKKAVINPKNENDDECLRWSIICSLNYNEITKKILKVYLIKLKMKIKIFHHIKETGKILNKIINQLPLISYFYQKMVKK